MYRSGHSVPMIAQLDQLTSDDRAALIHILDHMLANNRVRAALTGHAS